MSKPQKTMFVFLEFLGGDKIKATKYSEKRAENVSGASFANERNEINPLIH